MKRIAMGVVAACALAAILSAAAVAGDPAAPPPKVTKAADPVTYYPAESKLRGEQGSPVVQACVDAGGNLSREPVVTESSGFPELDAAAIKVAKATRYSPAKEGGVPLPESCIKFRVKFVLR